MFTILSFVSFDVQDKTIRLWNIERSEEIPIVVQNKKTIGLQVLTVGLLDPFTQNILSQSAKSTTTTEGLHPVLCVFSTFGCVQYIDVRGGGGVRYIRGYYEYIG